MIDKPTLLIGPSRDIDWRQGTFWNAAFYSAYLRRKGKGATPTKWAEDAAKRANTSYRQLTDLKSPIQAVILEPSRTAAKEFRRV